MIKYIFNEIQKMLLEVVKFFFGPADIFDNPGYLFFLLLIPGFILWYIWWYSPRRLIIPISYDVEKIANSRFNLGFLRHVPMVLSLIGFTLAIFALARPQSAPEITEQYSEGIDIMLVLDTSGSMEERDFPPNRLEVAKKRAMEFIEGRVDDRIGVVVFAEDAFSYAPLTLDYDLLNKQIKAIKSSIMPNRGTAMGSAIAVGINRMKESESPSKVMILLTDGASNRGQIDPITAAKLAKDEDIRIYSVGIGKSEYVRNTIFGPQKVPSELDEETLKKVSEISGGQFFRSQDPESLNEIFSIISRMEKTEIITETYRKITDKYPIILVWSLIFFTASFIFMVTFLYNPLEG